MKLIRLNLMFCFDMSRCKADWVKSVKKTRSQFITRTLTSNNNKKKIYNTHTVKR